MTTKKKPVRKTGGSGRSKNRMGLGLRLLLFFVALVIISLAVSYLIVKMQRHKVPDFGEIVPTLESNDTISIPTIENLIDSAIINDKPDELKPVSESLKKTDKPSVTGIVGTWVSTINGAMLTITKETYVIDFPSIDSRKPMKGNIKVSKGAFTVINDESDKDCGIDPGQYLFTLKGDDLTIIKKRDSCKKRSANLDAAWFRL